MSTSQAQIFDYCLKNCLFDGWGKELLENACKSLGLDKNYWKIEFPGGVIDVVDYFNKQCNEKLAVDLRVNDQRTTEKIRAALKFRLRMNTEYKEQIKTMLCVYTLHPNRAISAVYDTVDSIWRLAGDTAIDWNFYSKRLLLAGVYSSTLLFWLNDNSGNDEASWQFLNRRLAEVGKIGKGIEELKGKFNSLKTKFI